MRPKVELFEAIRRDARCEGLSIRALAERYGVNRSTVREALMPAVPAPRTPRGVAVSKPEPVKAANDEMPRADVRTPSVQRKAGRRIRGRLDAAHRAVGLSCSTVRGLVRRRRPGATTEAGPMPVPEPLRRRRRWPWIALGGVGLLALAWPWLSSGRRVLPSRRTVGTRPVQQRVQPSARCRLAAGRGDRTVSPVAARPSRAGDASGDAHATAGGNDLVGRPGGDRGGTDPRQRQADRRTHRHMRSAERSPGSSSVRYGRGGQDHHRPTRR